MNLQEIERVVATIQTQVFKKSNAWSAGALKSHFRGSGLQFREHQVYVAGDDVRFIDWNLSARTANTYIKTFEEERNIEIVVFLDLSPTLLYGQDGVSKLQALIEMAALLYILAGNTQDLVRVVIWSEKILTLPPKRGREGLTLFVSMLEKAGLIDQRGKVILTQNRDMNPQPEEVKVAQIKSYLSRRKEVVYLGDLSLMSNEDIWLKLLDRKNMHCFRIYSPVDKNTDIPFLFKAMNPLTGKGVVTDLKGEQLTPLALKSRYKEIGVGERYLEKFVRDLM
jgi:uncharacterized protein (DUF58 family)